MNKDPAIMMHSYAHKALDNQLEVLDGLLNLMNPSITPDENVKDRRPGKKAKKLSSEGDNEQTVTNSALMTVMARVEKMQEE